MKEADIFYLFTVIYNKFLQQEEEFSPLRKKIGRGFLIIELIGNKKKCNMKDIIEDLNLPPSTATRQVDNLVNLDLVRREIPKDNRRLVVLTLTNSGKEFYSDFQEHRKLFTAKVLQDFSKEEKDILIRALKKIIDISDNFTH